MDLIQESDDFENTDAEEFSCPTDPCPVIFCYCNGTVQSYSVTMEEMFRCVDDIISYFGLSVPEAINTPDDIYQLGTYLRTYIDEHIDDLSIEDEIAVEQRFETFARLERTLERRDYSDVLQHRNTGERVIKFHDVYVLASEVLVYTVVTDEFEEPRMIRYPKAYAEYLDEDEVTGFKRDFSNRFDRHFEDQEVVQSVN